MASRVVALLLLLLLRPVTARDELLKVSLLQRSVPPFALKRDIFLGAMPAAGDAQSGPRQAPAAQAETVRRTIAEEIAQSVSFEGYVSKNGRRSALLNVSGEFFLVNEGDMILQKIKILKISRETVTIEYDGLPYDINLKGDSHG